MADKGYNYVIDWDLAYNIYISLNYFPDNYLLNLGMVINKDEVKQIF